MLAKSYPVTAGDPVSRYLESRALVLPEPLASLRFAPALVYRHADGRMTEHPAMLAEVRGPNGMLVALHRTYLCADGRKADVPTVKKLTRTAGPMAGAAIRLRPIGKNGIIGCTEGIETGLAADRASDVPTWAAASASGLERFVWPAGARRLVVFADHDANGTGQRAAGALATRARLAGLSVSVLLPQRPGSDWCDVWAQHSRQGAPE